VSCKLRSPRDGAHAVDGFAICEPHTDDNRGAGRALRTAYNCDYQVGRAVGSCCQLSTGPHETCRQSCPFERKPKAAHQLQGGEIDVDCGDSMNAASMRPLNFRSEVLRDSSPAAVCRSMCIIISTLLSRTTKVIPCQGNTGRAQLRGDLRWHNRAIKPCH